MTLWGRNHDRAVVLAEAVVATILIGLVCGLGTTVTVRAIRLNAARGAYERRLESADFLLRNLARDVRRADAFRSQCGPYRSGEDTLILAVKDKHVIYVADKGVSRTEVVNDKSSRVTIIRESRLDVRFDLENSPSGRPVSVVTNVTWAEPPAIGISQPTLSYRSVLRN